MSQIQAFLFDKNYYNTKSAARWLAFHGKIPIKSVHTTNNYYRYRMIEPVKYGKYRTIYIDKGIMAVVRIQ